MKQPRNPELQFISDHVGYKIRTMRLIQGMSQAKLARHLNVTFQQVQKYENGSNKISANRLFQLSRIFHVPVTYFFDGLEGSIEKSEPIPDITPNEVRLLHDIRILPNSKTKQCVKSFIRSLAQDYADVNDN